jgi:hypothetical protein
MSHFSRLIDEVADQKNHSLSDVLLKAKVLASRLRSRKFRSWIDSELNGYDRDGELPKYRVLNAKIQGYFGGYFGSYMNGVPMSTSHMESDIRDAFDIARMPNGISYIEDLVSKDSGEIGIFMDGAAVNYLRLHGVRVSDMILNRVFKAISRHSLMELLNGVRSRLLDFLLDLRDKYPELDTNDAATSSVSESEVDAVVEKRVYKNCNVIERPEMRDNFQAGQAGAMGPNAKAENMNFIQVLRDSIGESSLGDLATDLERLRTAMLTESKTPEQDASVAAVAQAEDAAKKGNAQGVLSYLKTAGKWAGDVATKIGSAIAQKAIEKSMGL